MTTITIEIEIPEALLPLNPIEMFARDKGWSETDELNSEDYAIRWVKRFIRDDMRRIIVNKGTEQARLQADQLIG